MTVSTGATLKNYYETLTSMGDKAVASDSAFEIEGYEHMWLLTKAFPMPELSPAGEIEIPGPLGSMNGQPQQLQTFQQGSITLQETVKGHVNDMMIDLISGGGRFNAKIYEGTPDRHNGYRSIRNAWMQIDNPDRDWESRGEVLLFTGTVFFHYFGEHFPGNIS